MDSSEREVINSKPCTVIDSRGCKLTHFPNVDFSRLKYVYIAENDLKQLPDSLFTLAPNLLWLDARDNRICSIPESIENHPRLETLLLQNNDISYLPPSLGTVVPLRTLHLSGNPIVSPRRSVVDGGLEVLKRYLATKYEESKAATLKTDGLESLDSFRSSTVKTRRRRRIKKIQPDRVSCPPRNSNRYIEEPKSRSRQEQDLKIYEILTEEIQTETRKELMRRREKALQDAKSLVALKNWRSDYREAQMNNDGERVGMYYAFDLTNLPYDTDLNFVKILTRADIERDLPNKYKKGLVRNRPLGDRKSGKRNEINIQEKIDEIVAGINSIRTDGDGRSPESTRRTIACEIKQLGEFQKRIQSLKLKNDKSAFS